MSGWGPWSSCDSECGPGSQSRSRMVVRNAENGGKHCPQLMQHRGCQGTKCHTRNPKSALKGKSLHHFIKLLILCAQKNNKSKS